MPIAKAWDDITTTEPAWIDSQGEMILLRKTEVILPKRMKGCEVGSTRDDYYIFVKQCSVKSYTYGCMRTFRLKSFHNFNIKMSKEEFFHPTLAFCQLFLLGRKGRWRDRERSHLNLFHIVFTKENSIIQFSITSLAYIKHFLSRTEWYSHHKTLNLNQKVFYYIRNKRVHKWEAGWA